MHRVDKTIAISVGLSNTGYAPPAILQYIETNRGIKLTDFQKAIVRYALQGKRTYTDPGLGRTTIFSALSDYFKAQDSVNEKAAADMSVYMADVFKELSKRK